MIPPGALTAEEIAVTAPEMAEIVRFWDNIVAATPHPASQTFGIDQFLRLSEKLRTMHGRANNLGDIMLERFVAWQDTVTPYLPTLDPRDLARVLRSIAKLGLLPGEDFFQTWYETMHRKRLSLRFDAAADVFSAFGDYGILPNEALHDRCLDVLHTTLRGLLRSEKSATKHISSFKNRNDVLPIYLARMDCLDPSEDHVEIARMSLKTREKTRASAPPSHIAGAVRQACYWLDLTPPDDERHIDTSTRVSNTETQLEKLIYNTRLKSMPSEWRAFPELDKACDMVVRNLRGETFWVEFDGPHHFVTETKADGAERFYNGSTRFQSALMRKFYPERPLVRIPLAGLSHRGDDSRRTVLQAAFEDATSPQPAPGETLILLVDPPHYQFTPM